MNTQEIRLQYSILQLLNSKYKGNRPVDGMSGTNIIKEIGIPEPEVYAAIGEMEDRGLIIRDHRTGDNRSGYIVITSSGKDLLLQISERPKVAAKEKQERRNKIIWDVIKLIIAAICGAVAWGMLQKIGWIK